LTSPPNLNTPRSNLVSKPRTASTLTSYNLPPKKKKKNPACKARIGHTNFHPFICPKVENYNLNTSGKVGQRRMLDKKMSALTFAG
jgi:hypothetical protein